MGKPGGACCRTATGTDRTANGRRPIGRDCPLNKEGGYGLESSCSSDDSATRAGFRDIDIPAIGDDEALVRIEACGIRGTDYEWFRGDLHIAYPVILGHEPLGVIEVIGSKANRRRGVKVGHRVAVRCQYRCGR